MIYEKQRLPLLCIGLYWFKNCKNFLVLAFLLVFKLFNDAPSLPMILGGILLFLLVCLIFAVLSIHPLYLSNRSNECASQQRTLYPKTNDFAV